MTSARRALFWASIAFAALVVLAVGGFGLARALGSGEVLGSVVVEDVALGGLDRQGAADALLSLEDRLVTTPAPFVVAGSRVVLQPIQVGFDLHEEAIVDRAMELGREGSLFQQFSWWLRHLFTTVRLQTAASIDTAALEEVLEQWDEEAVGNPPFPGAIEVQDGVPVARYPEPGEEIDRRQAPELVLTQLSRLEREPVELPVVAARPVLSEGDVERALHTAQLWLSGPVTLVAEGGEVSLAFTPAELASAFRSEVVRQSPARMELYFDPEQVAAILAPHQAAIELPPVDARLEVEGTEVRLIPGRNGTLIAPEETALALQQAAGTAARTGVLPMREGAEPEVTTAELEALDIRHMVSEFTTYHDCCQARVTNIHLIADEVDGAIVLPGESFSLNQHVGRRTAEEGYLPAGTIIAGELVDTVGGGVSQFATTFYNAVFWGGYEDIEHSPHSFYFSRYPEGIEATISWPQPDLVFRNDSDSAVLIKTAYTDTSITVRFYGNNDGRMLRGEQRNGRLNIEVLAEGGPAARRVSAEVSGRYDYRDPAPPLYRGNPDLGVDEQRVVQSSAQGWSVTVTRTITVGEDAFVREWIVRYRPRQEIIEVHPCKVPDSGVACPTTTTTTVAPPPTTVAPTTSTSGEE